MEFEGISKLGARMARRNHLNLFAWLSALAVPVMLQVIAGSVEDSREFLAEYYGPISLYMFFSMTYGFAIVFVSYYFVSGYRKAGTLDILRVTSIQPAAIVFGVYQGLLRILLPPALVFFTGFAVYTMFFSPDSFLREAGLGTILAFMVIITINQAILAAIPLTALYRREDAMALVGAIMVLPVNTSPLVGLIAMGSVLPDWLALLLVVMVMLVLLSGLLFVAVRSVSYMWPPQSGMGRVK